MRNQNNGTYSLTHTRWKCQYHIVFTPKYRRKIIYGALRAEIGKILRELCRRKEVEIIEAHAMPDHIHMLVSIPPNERVSEFMGYLKGKSTMIIFERYAHTKYKYGNRHFWSRGYYVSTVGGNKQAERNILSNPFKRYEDMNMMRHTKTLGVIEVDSTVWKKLTPQDIAQILAICDKKLDEYYGKIK